MHLAEATDELAARRAAELGFEKSTGNWRALIADPEVEVVSVTTPNQFHAEMATTDRATRWETASKCCSRSATPKLS